MNPTDFANWLKGFLAAAPAELTSEQAALIREELAKVTQVLTLLPAPYTPAPPTIAPPYAQYINPVIYCASQWETPRTLTVGDA